MNETPEQKRKRLLDEAKRLGGVQEKPAAPTPAPKTEPKK